MTEKWPTSAVELVAALLQRAMDQEASDLYWLPQEEGALVRMRRLGRQETLATIAPELADQALTHLKVRAGLLTYKTRIAQDGRLDLDCGTRRISARVASMPTLTGERITIRFQKNLGSITPLPQLGFCAETLARVNDLLVRENGLILLTGPTGSGKTTTIYGMIQALLDADDDPASIITIEDPIECRISGISQTMVRHDDEEWNYESGLRAALRQDVKTLVVGEIRDARVARMVIDAALTGHRVISTFHGGDVAAVYARLLHLGFEPFLIGAAVRGVVAQRLVHDTHGNAIPIAAVHKMDDTWRDLICTAPSLADMRNQLQAISGADLATAAQAAAAAERISAVDAKRIGEYA